MTAYTTPKSAKGTTITWNSHDIGYINSLSGPSISAETKEIFTHDSADGYAEHIVTKLDGGEINIEVEFIPGDTTGQSIFRTDMDASTERQVIITFPDSSTWTFNAVATGFATSEDPDNSLLATLKMKVSGKPVFAAS